MAQNAEKQLVHSPADMLELAPGISATATSLRLPPGLSLDDWTGAARKITNVGYAYWWWVADLAAYAFHNYAGEDKDTALGELQHAVGVRSAHIRVLAITSRTYAVGDRVPNLSISHHTLVHRLDPIQRTHLLQRAAERGWSTRFLREQALPPGKRMMTVLLRLPAKYRGDEEFKSGLNRFAAKWEGTAKIVHWDRPHQTTRRKLA